MVTDTDRGLSSTFDQVAVLPETHEVLRLTTVVLEGFARQLNTNDLSGDFLIICQRTNGVGRVVLNQGKTKIVFPVAPLSHYDIS
mmetsp:Transcript_9603/g.19882  ORF Transcript_9603/g.19882 Transcript_9603/m.19882 type:complete len:85 (-) Transcript_9603:51-305(-)